MLEIETMRFNRAVWLLNSGYYFYIEYLLFLWAFLQVCKYHRYFENVVRT